MSDGSEMRDEGVHGVPPETIERRARSSREVRVPGSKGLTGAHDRSAHPS